MRDDGGLRVDGPHRRGERRVVAREILADGEHTGTLALVPRLEERCIDGHVHRHDVLRVEIGQLDELRALRLSEADDARGRSQRRAQERSAGRTRRAAR